VRRFFRWIPLWKRLVTRARPLTITPAASESTWRWSSHLQGPWWVLRYRSIFWRNQESSNRLREEPLGLDLWAFLNPDYYSQLIFLICRGEKNFHIFYYIYAGLYHQDNLKKYRLPNKTAPRFVCLFGVKDTLIKMCNSESRSCIYSVTDRDHRFTLLVCSFRYIDCVNGKVMQDIISNKLYKEQFDAIQDCFRIIGFTEEVQLKFWFIFLNPIHLLKG